MPATSWIGCKTLRVSPTQRRPVTRQEFCENEPPCVVDRETRGRVQWSIAQLQNAVAEPDIVAALAR